MRGEPACRGDEAIEVRFRRRRAGHAQEELALGELDVAAAPRKIDQRRRGAREDFLDDLFRLARDDQPAAALLAAHAEGNAERYVEADGHERVDRTALAVEAHAERAAADRAVEIHALRIERETV